MRIVNINVDAKEQLEKLAEKAPQLNECGRAYLEGLMQGMIIAKEKEEEKQEDEAC